MGREGEGRAARGRVKSKRAARLHAVLQQHSLEDVRVTQILGKNGEVSEAFVAMCSTRGTKHKRACKRRISPDALQRAPSAGEPATDVEL